MMEDLVSKDLTDAHQELTAGDKSLDAMADLILSRVAKFFGECVGDESFCAIAVDETRDQSGKITSLKLIACDDVAGTPSRRVPKESPLQLVKA